MNIEDIIDNLLAPVSYNYDIEACEAFIDVLIGMINRNRSRANNYSEVIFQLAFFVYQQFVMFFGDYGVSPRGGWIEDEYKEEVISDLIEWIEREKRADELNN